MSPGTSDMFKHALPSHPIRPGTCIIFPSFLPHFVIPTRPLLSAPGTEQQQQQLRVSAAFNFGACEPVCVQMWEQEDRDRPVRIYLEAEPVYGV